MDGHFVPNITIGAPVVKAHLAGGPRARGGARRAPHDRAPGALRRGFRRRRRRLAHRPSGSLRPPSPHPRPDPRGRRPGGCGAQPCDAARKPGRGPRRRRPRAHHVGRPGVRGQRFIDGSLDKLRRARAYLPAAVAIQVDGGVSLDNAALLVAAGANLLVAGNSVYGAADPARAFRELAAAVAAARARRGRADSTTRHARLPLAERRRCGILTTKRVSSGRGESPHRR